MEDLKISVKEVFRILDWATIQEEHIKGDIDIVKWNIQQAAKKENGIA